MRSDGAIEWGGELAFVSETLGGETVGVAETAGGEWLVRFADPDLGIIDGRTKKLHRLRAARPGRPQATQDRNIVTHVSGL